ncbi:MAG: glutamine amidotransferase-related protein [Dialister invisus]
MQCAVIEFARNVCHMEQANSSEFIPDGNIPSSISCPIRKTSRKRRYHAPRHLSVQAERRNKGENLYENQEIVYERHRHRYEVSNEFRPQMEAAGLVVSGTSPDDRLVEIIELKIIPTLPPPRPIRNSRAA